jgi:AraC-like DNA-binding protein
MAKRCPRGTTGAACLNGGLPGVEELRVLARESHYNPGKLAVRLKLSRRGLERHFRQHLGWAPCAWLELHRAVEAAALLLSGQSVKEVAVSLLYCSTSHLDRHFKKVFGMTPSEFVARQRG